MDLVLGIDVGGTAIKAGLFDFSGELVAARSIPTPALVDEEAYSTVTSGLVELLHSRGADVGDVAACGLDIPGPVNEEGVVPLLSNIELDVGGLGAAIRSCLPSARLALVNDANAAALGELWHGSARGERSFVMVTLGTGVGGVVVDGRLVCGRYGAGGEIGHMTVNPDESLVCGCGRRGCLEQYASAKGLVRLYGENCARLGVDPVSVEHETDALAVFRALAAGDEAASASVGQMCEYLAIAFSQISCIVDPGAFLIGGGVAGSFPAFAEDLERRFRGKCLGMCEGTRIAQASLGNEAGMYGAAYEALRAGE